MELQTRQERAARIVADLEALILETLRDHPNGLRNIEVAKMLGLESPPGADQKNWLTWLALKKLLASKAVETDNGKPLRYRIPAIPQGKSQHDNG